MQLADYNWKRTFESKKFRAWLKSSKSGISSSKTLWGSPCTLFPKPNFLAQPRDGEKVCACRCIGRRTMTPKPFTDELQKHNQPKILTKNQRNKRLGRGTRSRKISQYIRMRTTEVQQFVDGLTQSRRHFAFPSTSYTARQWSQTSIHESGVMRTITRHSDWARHQKRRKSPSPVFLRLQSGGTPLTATRYWDPVLVWMYLCEIPGLDYWNSVSAQENAVAQL